MVNCIAKYAEIYRILIHYLHPVKSRKKHIDYKLLLLNTYPVHRRDGDLGYISTDGEGRITAPQKISKTKQGRDKQ